MQEIIINIMNEWGYIGIMLLIAVENIFPPIPSEVILIFGGFITTCSKISIIGVILAATIGSEIGAIILYLIGKNISQEMLEKIVSGKVGKIFGLKKEDIEKSYNWFKIKGNSAVLFCRCIPIVRSLISIPAGMTKMKITKFLILTLIGTVIWNTIIIIIGRYAGAYWEDIVIIMNKYSHLILIIIIAVIIIKFIYKKRRNTRCGEISINIKIK